MMGMSAAAQHELRLGDALTALRARIDNPDDTAQEPSGPSPRSPSSIVAAEPRRRGCARARGGAADRARSGRPLPCYSIAFA
jgi:hypothetical protein